LSQYGQWDSGLNTRQFESPPELIDSRPRDEPDLSKCYPNRSLLASCLLCVDDRVLLSRRAIWPRLGFWTIPGGFVEEGESTECGACRELEEEAGVSIVRAKLLAVYEMPQISQVMFMYMAMAECCNARAGPESGEVSLCLPREVPASQLAFATDRRALYRLINGEVDSVEYGQFRWGADGRIRMSPLA
jgi:ADP-ribose pyrophosphatase YjhB (NUDIX family)